MISLLRKTKKKTPPICTALVAAAGSGTRMGGVNKLTEPLSGIPVLVHTLRALEQSSRVNYIVVATREEEIVPMSQLCKAYGIGKCTKVIRGGETRTHSVLLAAMEAPAETQYLAVQDGARPLVTPTLIDATIEAAWKCGAAAPAIALKDTVKEVDARSVVVQTLARDVLRGVQTPQVFEGDLLKAALQNAIEKQIPITDDCSAVEQLGKQVCLIPGEETNLKITTPMDLAVAQMLLDRGLVTPV